MRKPRILLACLKSDFGENGIEQYNDQGEFINPSWEYTNLYVAWEKIADAGLVELETHWVDQQSDQKGLNRLVTLAKDVTMVWQIPVTHALGIHLPQARKIIDGGTPIVSFHPDIHMRYQHPAGDQFVHSRVTEGYDTHTLSPAKHMMQQLADNGVKAYHMPFGIPDYCDRDLGATKEYDISFVGQKHGIREQVIGQFRAAGLKVDTWGHFWSPHQNYHGRPTIREMVDVFNRSKVNLNLRWCSRSPSYGQVKGRCMELMGCGAFMLASQHSETNDLHELYQPDCHFVEAHFVNELIEKAMYYVKNDHERQVIASQAYQKREENLWTTRLKKFLNSNIWTK